MGKGSGLQGSNVNRREEGGVSGLLLKRSREPFQWTSGPGQQRSSLELAAPIE
jgi:hypothetical protein